MKNNIFKTIAIFTAFQVVFMIIYSHCRETIFSEFPGHYLGMITFSGTILILFMALRKLKQVSGELLNYKRAILVSGAISLLAPIIFNLYWLMVNINNTDSAYLDSRLERFINTSVSMLVFSCILSIFFRKPVLENSNKKLPVEESNMV